MKAFVFDTETTGLIRNRLIPLDDQPEIIEFYGCLVEFGPKGYKVKSEVERMFRPSKPITEEITKITGITNEMVQHCGVFRQFGPTLKKIIEGAPLVIAHNASFDKEMVEIEMQRLDIKIKWPRIICTVEQTIGMKGYRLNLSRLHEMLFNEKFSGAHRAREDVQALVKCCSELSKKGIL